MTSLVDSNMHTPLSGEKKSWMDVLKDPMAVVISPSTSDSSFDSVEYRDTPVASPTAPLRATTGEHASSFMAAFSEKFGEAPNAYKQNVGGYAPPESGAMKVRDSQETVMSTVKLGTEDKGENEIDSEYEAIAGNSGSNSTNSMQAAVVAAKNFNIFSCVVDSCFTVANTLGLQGAASKLAAVSADAAEQAKREENDKSRGYNALLEGEMEFEPQTTAPVVATF